MKKFCQLITLSILVMICFSNVVYSQPYGPMSRFENNSTPMPFNEIDQPKNEAAASTGYYFMDNGANTAYTKWLPGPNPDGSTIGLLPETYQPHLWYRIYPGPRSVPVNERESGYDPVNHLILPPTVTGKTPTEGYRYFRNPAQHSRYLNMLDNEPGIDTVRSAIAGPIPIGFAFYMNGIRYDSFYVSARGIIALSNRRYLYDGEGRRAVPPNKTDCYDPMSADWPFPNNSISPTQGRRHLQPGSILSADPNYETTYDNYGFLNIACGGDPLNPTAGIREYMMNGDGVGPNNTPPSKQPTMFMRLSDNVYAGGAFITPFEGPVFLPQWNEKLNYSDDRGQVLYKRSNYSDKLIIYFKNIQLDTGTYIVQGSQIETFIIQDGRPDSTPNCVSGSCQVELNRIDSSITFRYGGWDGNAVRGGGGPNNTAYDMLQPYISIAIGGYARHKNYNTKDPASYTRSELDPWAGQYMQYTQEYNGFYSKEILPAQKTSRILTQSFKIKFKQWRNSLRIADIQYYVRKKEANATEFDESVITSDVQDNYNPFELFAGHEQLGKMQPVAIIQNLTNDIQGPTGNNFVEQDFQFQTRLLIRNRVTNKYVYNRYSKISDACLHDFPENRNPACGQNDPYASIRYSSVTKDNSGNYIATPKTLEEVNAEGINGIPSYGFVQVRFPIYNPNEFIENAIGLMELTAITDPVNPNTNELIGDDWPFDDSARISFWVINRLNNFRCNGEFNYADGIGYISNVNQWVYSRFSTTETSVRIVEGGVTATTLNPLPPLGREYCLNDNYRVSLNGPMYHLKWATVSGNVVPSKITSFPIDLRNRNGSMLTLATQRATSDATILNRGFSDATLIGPEARVVFNTVYDNIIDGNLNSVSNYSGKLNGSLGLTEEQNPDFDYLAVEYLKPSPDGVKFITNTGGNENIKKDEFNNPEASADVNNPLWRYHPHWVGLAETTPIVQNAPALAVFGGGGYFLGWTFANNQSYFPANWNGGKYEGGDNFGGGGIVAVNRNLAINQRIYYTVLAPGTQKINNIEVSPNLVVGGLRANPYDAGFDFEFYRYSVAIPDFFIEKSIADLGKNFRFRIKMIEDDNYSGTGDQMGLTPGSANPPNIPDDEDVFLVDNVAIMFPDIMTDLEAQVVKIIWPYTKVPASQANNLNIIARIANMGTANAQPFLAKIRVYKQEVGTNEDPTKAIFCQSMTISQLLAGQSTEITVSGFSPRTFCDRPDGQNIFTLQLIIEHIKSGNELYSLNDTIISIFNINLGDDFSYTNSLTNDVPTFANVVGKGLSLAGTAFSGYVEPSAPQPPFPVDSKLQKYKLSNASSYAGGRYWNFWSGFGGAWLSYVCGGNLDGIFPGYPYDSYLSGQIAMKFELSAADTLKGFRALFGKANSAFDDIAFRIYSDNNGIPGTEIVNPQLPLYGHRLMSKAANGTETIQNPDAFIYYELRSPIRLEQGTYWMSIDQLGETGLELGATGSSMAMRTMLVSVGSQGLGGDIGNVGVMGSRGIQLMLDKRFRVPTTDPTYGRVYVNNNVFAYKNIIGGESWKQFMPTSGDIAYGHLNHLGMLDGKDNNYATFTRGTWNPLISPVFGIKTITADTAHYPCPDDLTGEGGTTAIEVTDFYGHVRDGGIDIQWETVTEIDNSQFILERAELNSDVWTEIYQVAGAGLGTTTEPQFYGMHDENVVAGTAYKYRLYSMAFDGTISCQNNNVITIEFNDDRTITLNQNNPNPFSNETNIAFNIPTEQMVTLEVLDIFGNVVKTLVKSEMLKGNKNYVWNGLDENGMKVADGHYIYRLTAGETIKTMKLSFIKAN